LILIKALIAGTTSTRAKHWQPAITVSIRCTAALAARCRLAVGARKSIGGSAGSAIRGIPEKGCR
jgi:hypothetical protein